MGMSQYRDAIRADLISDIAISGDAISPDKDGLNAAPAHEMTDHIVGNQGQRDAFLLQLPGCQTCPLKDGAGLIDKDMEVFTRFMRDIHGGESCAPTSGSYSAGITMRQDRIAC